MDLVQKYLGVLPEGPFRARMAEVEHHLPDTHFCWIGGFAEDSPFYYRVQSPVTFIEFDHHAGVFLTNPEPAKFHVHTIVRTSFRRGHFEPKAVNSSSGIIRNSICHPLERD